MRKSIFLFLGVLSVLFVFGQNTSDKAKGQKNINSPKLIPQIPNPSFEDTLCYPTSFSQMSCCDYWMQAGDATSDYFNTHGFFPSSVPLPIPDGDACVGEIFTETWKEYVGICLPQPLDSGVNYTFTMSIAFRFTNDLMGIASTTDSISPVNITLFGDTSCSNLPFSSYLCPVGFGGWQELGYVTVNPYDVYGSWDTYTISFTPTRNISALIFGPPCVLPPDSLYQNINNSCLPYFFFDDISSLYTSLQVNSSDDVSLKIFPNPSDGKFILNYNIGKKEGFSLFVYSISGQLILKDHISRNSSRKILDLSRLPEGIFFIKLQTNTTVLTRKIIVKR